MTDQERILEFIRDEADLEEEPTLSAQGRLEGREEAPQRRSLALDHHEDEG